MKMAKPMEKLNMIKDLALVGKKKISLKMKKAIKRVHYERLSIQYLQLNNQKWLSWFDTLIQKT